MYYSLAACPEGFLWLCPELGHCHAWAMLPYPSAQNSQNTKRVNHHELLEANSDVETEKCWIHIKIHD